MYEAFFQFKCKPFSLLPDPDFLFLSSRHSIALSLLEYSLTGQAGFCVITGEIGSGKTTLVRAFLGRVGREFSIGLISNTHSSITDIAGWALTAFGQKQVSNNPAEVHQQLMTFLIAEYGAGRQCILIVDEAQNLSINALEELRLLSNINSGKDLLLQILLVGQPELLEKLQRPELRQFAQRIAISHHLSPLKFAETRQYISHRLAVAGATKPIFNELAVGAVQYFSGGVPRLINSICDLCLVYAFADGALEIDEGVVFRVVTDRRMSGIAPFANNNPADDPAVREEISVIARSGAPVALPDTDKEAKLETGIKADHTAPVALNSRVATSEPAADVSPNETANPVLTAVSETKQPVAVSPQPLRAATLGPSDFYFNGEDGDESDLLLTRVITEASSPRLMQRGPQSNGADRSVVLLHADPSEPLAESPRPRDEISNNQHQFPVIEGDRRGPTYGGNSLRMEETLRQVNPSGTRKPHERSWWRRAFRSEG